MVETSLDTLFWIVWWLCVGGGLLSSSLIWTMGKRGDVVPRYLRTTLESFVIAWILLHIVWVFIYLISSPVAAATVSLIT